MRLVNALFALALAVGGLTLPAVQATIADAGVSVTVVPGASGTLAPGQDLALTVTVTNGTQSALDAGTIRIYLNRTAVALRSQLADWLDPAKVSASNKLGTNVGEVAFSGLAAKETQVTPIVIPAAAIGLSPQPSTWGARTLAATVSTAKAQLGQGRSSIVWYPGGTIHPTNLTMVVPLTVPPDVTGLLTSDTLAAYTAPAGLLTRQLDAIANQPVVVGIDPMIIASIRVLGTSAPPSATAWLARLATISNETFALNYADSDLAAVSQAGHASALQPIRFILNPALFLSQPVGPSTSATPSTTPTPHPSSTATTPGVPTSAAILQWPYTITGLAWPGADTVVAADLNAFKENGLPTTILSSSNVASTNVSYTPSAAATVNDHQVLISDSTISALLSEATLAPTEAKWQAAMAELSATLAVVTRERPQGSRALLATFGRPALPTGFRLAETMAALQQLPWAGRSTLANTISVAPTAATIINKPELAPRIASINSLLKSEQAVTQFASVLTDPTLITGPRRLELLSLLSDEWSQGTSGWAGRVSTYLTASTTIVGSVKIADSSSINLLADHTSLPVSVSNSLSYPVTVYVHVRALSALLNIMDDRVALTLEPTSQKRAMIPVQSIANGHVTLQVTLTSGTNVPIGQATLVDINVQAGWETAATVVIAVILVGVFGFGFWRNIAKRRKGNKTADSDDAAVPDQEPSSSEPHE